ncbi:MAG: hypothetical protein ABI877_14855 [Gemmatimonadaceae bacterium]
MAAFKSGITEDAAPPSPIARTRVSALDSAEAAGTLYYVMPYYGRRVGDSLRARLARLMWLPADATDGPPWHRIVRFEKNTMWGMRQGFRVPSVRTTRTESAVLTE